jgi:hypothetical protein
MDGRKVADAVDERFGRKQSIATSSEYRRGS